MGEAFERDAVDREDLVASLEFPVFWGRAGLEDGLDVDGHVAVRGAEPSDDGEPESLVAPDKGDGFGGAVDDLKESKTFYSNPTKTYISLFKAVISWKLDMGIGIVFLYNPNHAQCIIESGL